MDLTKKLTLCFFLLFVLYYRNVHGQDNLFKVTDFGAVPDGKTDSSKAFLKAWLKACSTNGGGLLVPEGTFLVEKALFKGPCAGETIFQVIGNVVATQNTGLENKYWIQFSNIVSLKLDGTGTFDGQGASSWSHNDCKKSPNCTIPHANIRISNMKNSAISRIKSLNSKGFHIHLSESNNVVMKNIHISAPDESPNTDGIHVARSNDIEIINTIISTGDDCVSLGPGVTNISITGVHCGPGHGISIGSLGKNSNEKDVKGITVTNCTFTKTQNGLRIKTWTPSANSIVVSDVTFSHITMKDSQNPIIIDQHYCPNGHCKSTGDSDITIKDVKFIDIKGTSTTDVAVNLQCSQVKPCKGIKLQGLDLKMSGSGEPTKATCVNSDTTFVGGNQVPASC